MAESKADDMPVVLAPAPAMASAQRTKAEIGSSKPPESLGGNENVEEKDEHKDVSEPRRGSGGYLPSALGPRVSTSTGPSVYRKSSTGSQNNSGKRVDLKMMLKL